MRLLLIATICVINSIGYAQNALNLDGVNDFVQTSYTGISGNAARTVEAWIKTTANCNPSTGGSQQVITDWGTQATGGRFTFNILWSNAIRIEVNGNGLSGTIPVNDGNWHHVAVVWDPASATPAQLYVDGTLDVAGTLTVAVNTGSSVNMRIGKRIDDQKHFEGTIDEVRVWSTAKSLVNLMATMNDELCVLPADLEAYYTFNQGTANGSNPTEITLYDQSGNGNNGAVTNLTLTGASSNWVPGVSLGSGFTSSYTSITECDQYTWPANGQTYTASGIYNTTLTNGAGCDSIATLDLTINVANDLTNNVTTCDDFTWPVSGQTYTADTYIDTVLYNGFGCAYNHVLNLTINNSTAGTDVIIECDSLEWIDGVTYYASTSTPTWTLMNAAGCDSIVTLDLTINTSNTSNLTETAIDTYTLNGQTYTTSGTYMQSLTTVEGCDSTINLDLTIEYTGLDEKTANISVYPNPVQNELHVASDYILSRFEITDIHGRLVLDDVLNPSGVVDTRLLTKGVYFIAFEDQPFRIRFIKN